MARAIGHCYYHHHYRHRTLLSYKENLSYSHHLRIFILLFCLYCCLQLREVIGVQAANDPNSNIDAYGNNADLEYLSLSSDRQDAIGITIRIFCSLSLLFSCVVFISFILLSTLQQEYTSRFILFIAAADIITSILLIIGPISTNGNSSERSLIFSTVSSSSDITTPSYWCTAHGSIILYSTLVSFLWTNIIAFNHLICIKYAATITNMKQYEKYEHIIAWMTPCIIIILMSTVNVQHHPALYSPLCWIGFADATIAFPSSLYILYIPLCLSLCFTGICYFLAWRYSSMLSTQIIATNSLPVSHQMNNKRILMKKRIIAYIFCATILIAPGLLSLVSSLVSTSLSDDYQTFMWTIQAIICSSQGLLHASIYAWNSRLFFHLFPSLLSYPIVGACLSCCGIRPPSVIPAPLNLTYERSARQGSLFLSSNNILSPEVMSRVLSSKNSGNNQAEKRSSLFLTLPSGAAATTSMRAISMTTAAIKRDSDKNTDPNSSGEETGMVTQYSTPVFLSRILMQHHDSHLATMRDSQVSAIQITPAHYEGPVEGDNDHDRDRDTIDGSPTLSSRNSSLPESPTTPIPVLSTINDLANISQMQPTTSPAVVSSSSMSPLASSFGPINPVLSSHSSPGMLNGISPSTGFRSIRIGSGSNVPRTAIRSDLDESAASMTTAAVGPLRTLLEEKMENHRYSPSISNPELPTLLEDEADVETEEEETAQSTVPHDASVSMIASPVSPSANVLASRDRLMAASMSLPSSHHVGNPTPRPLPRGSINVQTAPIGEESQTSSTTPTGSPNPSFSRSPQLQRQAAFYSQSSRALTSPSLPIVTRSLHIEPNSTIHNEDHINSIVDEHPYMQRGRRSSMPAQHCT